MEWNKIKPLSQYEAETLVAQYFKNSGFIANKIEETSVDEGCKVPDLEIKELEEVVGYVEIKTPGHNLNPKTNLYQWNTTFNKLRTYSRNSVKQLSDYDKKHEIPWILAITSNHPQLNWTSYQHRINKAVSIDGQIIKDFNKNGVQRKIDEDIMKLDMTIWFQVNYMDRKTTFDIKFFVNSESKFKKEIIEISDKLILKK